MEVDKIDKAYYEGYYWLSDKKQPTTLDGKSEFEMDLSKVENPFVIEAQLFAGDVSYSVKFADGRYIAHKYNVSDYKSKADIVTQEVCYRAHRVGNDVGISGLFLNFLQVWKEEKDDSCLGMKVLQPKELVFVGFKK